MPQGSTKTSRMEDIAGANKIIDSIMEKINSTKFNGIILVASNPLDIMTYKIAKLYNNKYNKVIGSGTLLDSSRLIYELSNRLGFPVKSISGMVCGEHGDSQFVVWSSIKVAQNYSIDDYITQKEKLEIEEKVKRDGFSVAKLQGYTCFGVATALSKITRVIINDEKAEIPVSTYDKENDVYISSLSRIGKDGVEANKLYSFNKNEQELYDLSCRIIKEGINSINI